MGSRPLSIIIPVLNEERTLVTLLENVRKQKLPNLNLEKDIMVIIDEQCSDNSYSEALNYAKRYPEIRVIAHGKKGKGAAIKTGLLLSKGDIILIQDSDLEYSTDDYPELLAPLVFGNKLFVLGHRCPKNEKTWRIRSHASGGYINWMMDVAGFCFNQFINFLFKTQIVDQACMFKVFHKEIVKDLELESDGFALEVELLAKLFKKGFRPVQVPVNYQPRSFEEGKKIRPIRDGFVSLYYLLKVRFV